MDSDEEQFEKQRERKLAELKQLEHQQLARYRQRLDEALQKLADSSRQIAILSQSSSKNNKLQQSLAQTITQLNETLTTKQAQINRLNTIINQKVDAIERLELQVKLFKADHQECPSRFEGLKRQLEEKEELIAKTIRENSAKIQLLEATHKTELDKLQQQFRGALAQKEQQIRNQKQSNKNSLEISLQDLKNEFAGKLQEEQKRRQKMQAENIRLTEEGGRLLKQINQQKNNFIDLEQKYNTEVLQIKLRLKQREYQVQNLRKQLDFQKGERKDDKRKLAESLAEKEETDKQLELNKRKHRQDLKQFRAKAEEKLQEYIQENEIEVGELKHKINIMTSELNSKSSLIAELQSENKVKAQEYIRSLESQSKKWEHQIQSLNKELKGKEKLIQRKEKQIKTLEGEVQTIKDKMGAVLKQYDQVLENKSVLQKQNKMLLSEIVFWRDKNKKSQEENDKNTNNKTKKPMRSSGNPIDDVKSDVSCEENQEDLQNQVAQELEAYKTFIADMQAQVINLAQRLEKNDKQLTEKNDYIGQLQNIIKKLQIERSRQRNSVLFSRQKNSLSKGPMDSLFSSALRHDERMFDV